ALVSKSESQSLCSCSYLQRAQRATYQGAQRPTYQRSEASDLPPHEAGGAAASTASAEASTSDWSSSDASTRSIACSDSPSPSRIRVTPWVLRPTCAISEARVRTSVPPSEISRTSWLSLSWIAPTSLPLRALVCSAITPWVPRPLRGYSETGVRLP